MSITTTSLKPNIENETIYTLAFDTWQAEEENGEFVLIWNVNWNV